MSTRTEDPRISALRTRKFRHIDAATAIIDRARHAGRKPTSDERGDIDAHTQAAQRLQDEMAAVMRAASLDRLGDDLATPVGGGGSGGLYAAAMAAGFDRVSNPQVAVPWSSFMAAVSFDGDYSDAVPSYVTTPPLGADQRFLHPVFPQRDVEPDVTSIQTFRQVSRTLPNPVSSMVRAIDAVTEKPEVDTATELVDLPLKQIAITEQGVPNVVLASSAARQWVDVDLRFSFASGVDWHVISEIATSVSAVGDPGSDLLESILNAVETVLSAGYSPSVLAASPQTLLALQLLRQPGSSDYVFSGNAPPLGGLRRVAVTGLETPYVIDPAAVGEFYTKGAMLRVFEENAGQTNSSTVRLEAHCRFVVQRSGAAAEVNTGEGS